MGGGEREGVFIIRNQLAITMIRWKIFIPALLCYQWAPDRRVVASKVGGEGWDYPIDGAPAQAKDGDGNVAGWERGRDPRHNQDATVIVGGGTIMENYSPHRCDMDADTQTPPSFSGPIPLPDSMFESGVLNWREGDDNVVAVRRGETTTVDSTTAIAADAAADRVPTALLRFLCNLFRRAVVPGGVLQILVVLGTLLLAALAQAMGLGGRSVP